MPWARVGDSPPQRCSVGFNPCRAAAKMARSTLLFTSAIVTAVGSGSVGGIGMGSGGRGWLRVAVSGVAAGVGVGGVDGIIGGGMATPGAVVVGHGVGAVGCSWLGRSLRCGVVQARWVRAEGDGKLAVGVVAALLDTCTGGPNLVGLPMYSSPSKAW